MDPLSSLLQQVQPRGSIFFSGEFCGDFAVDTSGNGCAHFHVIAKGECWLQVGDRVESQPLLPGDLVMLPHDAKHCLLPRPPGKAEGERLEAYVSLICGYFEFASKRINPVLAALPEVVVLRKRDQPDQKWLDRLLEFLRRESGHQAAGANLVVDRLSDVLFVFILRSLMERGEQSPQFLRAFADPAIARALGAIHEQPEKAWNLERLAEAAALSRTVFASRFRQLTGFTPADYLARFRMDRAASWLRQGELTIDEIAERTGYGSSAAFAKAFKKVQGRTPGQVRRGGA